jgi:hypothetical protein
MRILCLLKHGYIWSAAELHCKYKCIYFTLLSTFIIKYAYAYFVDTYFSFDHSRTMKMLSLMCMVLVSSTLEASRVHRSGSHLSKRRISFLIGFVLDDS